MPRSGGPGQQAIPNAIRAMPATRATGMATPASCSPSNNWPTSEGAISNANPVTASLMAANASALFIAFPAFVSGFFGLRLFNRIRLRRCRRSEFCLGLRRVLHFRFELERQLVYLAGKLERRIVAILDHRDPGPGVLADVEGLVLRERDRCAVFNGLPVHFLAVHGEHACAALAEARTIRLEVEDDGVLARAQLRARTRSCA